MTEVVIASKEPFQTDVKEGKTYWWCACGRSKNQPFCDGSHKDTGFEPVEYTAKRDGKVFLCGCKHTKRAPLCDGSHKDL